MAIQNLDRLKKRIGAIPENIRKEVGKAIETGAKEIADMQRRLAPKGKTGDLAASIQVTKGGKGPAYAFGKKGSANSIASVDPDLGVTISAGNTHVRYAHLVEFGTKPHMIGDIHHPGATAKPFFYPAYRALKKRTRARIVRAGRKAAKDAAKA